MLLPRNLNPLARQVANKLVRAHPKFRSGLIVRTHGELEASIPAPSKSQAGHLIVLTNAGDIWVGLAVPHAAYSIDSTEELVEIIGGLLSDNMLFVVVSSRNRWLETTLVQRNADVQVDSKSGTVQVISWSGKHDETFRLRRGSLTKQPPNKPLQPTAQKRGG